MDNKIQKIIDVTSDYADCAYGWDMEAEGDFQDWVDSIKEILEESDNDEETSKL